MIYNNDNCYYTMSIMHIDCYPFATSICVEYLCLSTIRYFISYIICFFHASEEMVSVHFLLAIIEIVCYWEECS